MAIRSLTDIWVDANFKETQLRDLRIGQPVDLYVDMYGGRHVFKGRVAGFTMGTGSTLALLPAQNATGNFVKVVQRLPVRIELVDYDPDKARCSSALSVVPYVYINEPPTGPDAGKFLQAYLPRVGDPGPAPQPRREPSNDDAVLSPSGSRAAAKPLAGGRHRRGADLHGGARHHDRGRRAALYRGRPVGDGRRRRMGHHQLPCRQRHHPADHRLAVRRISAGATTSCCRSPCSR